MSAPLPFAINVRLSADQRALLEETASILDLTLSGAMRWHLDQVLDQAVNDRPDAPTRRELLNEEQGVAISESLLRAITTADAN